MAGREYQFRERDGEEYGCRIVSGRRHLKSGRRDREHGIFVDHRRRARGATRELGELNHVVAWWQYESLADRERRREHMMADPRWQEYLRMTNGMLDVQDPASSTHCLLAAQVGRWRSGAYTWMAVPSSRCESTATGRTCCWSLVSAARRPGSPSSRRTRCSLIQAIFS
jgi:hypothetical protein